MKHRRGKLRGLLLRFLLFDVFVDAITVKVIYYSINLLSPLHRKGSNTRLQVVILIKQFQNSKASRMRVTFARRWNRKKCLAKVQQRRHKFSISFRRNSRWALEGIQQALKSSNKLILNWKKWRKSEISLWHNRVPDEKGSVTRKFFAFCFQENCAIWISHGS